MASHYNATVVDAKEPQLEKNGCSSTELEVECQIDATKAISEVEVEHLLTRLRLIRLYVNKEQLQVPVLQYFEENLPNVSVVRNSEEGSFDLQWKHEDVTLSLYDTNGKDVHPTLLHFMSMAYPSCSATRQSIGGFQFSAKAVKPSLLCADDFPIGNCFSQEPLNSLMLGMPKGLYTPGADSQRLSIGMTPQTCRLP